MDDESKKPCAPVEEEGRDYDALGLFRREGRQRDPDGGDGPVGISSGMDGRPADGAG